MLRREIFNLRRHHRMRNEQRNLQSTTCPANIVWVINDCFEFVRLGSRQPIVLGPRVLCSPLVRVDFTSLQNTGVDIHQIYVEKSITSIEWAISLAPTLLNVQRFDHSKPIYLFIAGGAAAMEEAILTQQVEVSARVFLRNLKLLAEMGGFHVVYLGTPHGKTANRQIRSRPPILFLNRVWELLYTVPYGDEWKPTTGSLKYVDILTASTEESIYASPKMAVHVYMEETAYLQFTICYRTEHLIRSLLWDDYGRHFMTT